MEASRDKYDIVGGGALRNHYDPSCDTQAPNVSLASRLLLKSQGSQRRRRSDSINSRATLAIFL